jgi:Tfp pilus assembly protein PilO
MALATRILVERRAFVLPIVALALVNLGLYLFAVYPLWLRVSTLETRAAQARQARSAARRELADARALASGRERADAELQQFYREVLPADVDGARRITYARLADMAREAGLRYDRRTYDADTSYRGALQKLKITMVLEGDYASIRQFIHALETASEFVVIENVGLAERPQSGNTLTLTLELATYYRPGGHGT